MEQGQRFKALYASLGFSVDDAAKFLQVTPRTVQLWITGRVRVPYMAMKLMRLHLRYDLPGDAWDGWSNSAGRLYTPEGFELHPRDFHWWGLLARKASMFNALYDRLNPKTATKAGRPAAGTAGHAQHGPQAAPLGDPPAWLAAGAAGRPRFIYRAYLVSHSFFGNVSSTERPQNHESSATTWQPWRGGPSVVGLTSLRGRSHPVQTRAGGRRPQGALGRPSGGQAYQAGQGGQCPAQVRWSLRFKGAW
jgi:transcriptional regulator with XRE-family HTH domain